MSQRRLRHERRTPDCRREQTESGIRLAGGESFYSDLGARGSAPSTAHRVKHHAQVSRLSKVKCLHEVLGIKVVEVFFTIKKTSSQQKLYKTSSSLLFFSCCLPEEELDQVRNRWRPETGPPWSTAGRSFSWSGEEREGFTSAASMERRTADTPSRRSTVFEELF